MKKDSAAPQSLEYRSWAGMIQRCTNINNPMYGYYGKLGISVCKEWRKFETFLKNMGRRPSSKHTLDRKNNLGNYEPNNCRWSTREEQSQNRKSVLLTKNKAKKIRVLYKNGMRQTDIAKKYKVDKGVIHKVVKYKTWKNI